MAYLNVRERRIEARIAYVGSELAGKATNFDQLKLATNDARIGKIESTKTDDGDLLSLAWQPPESRFRDCNVLVKIVAQRGGVSAEQFADVLRESDGIVVVVDAHPSAQDRNRSSLAAVRSVLARAESRGVPIVIQVNKTDLPDALAADDVVGALQANDFTHVIAAASRGEGVVETLEAALNEVLSSMQSEAEQSTDAAPITVKPPAATSDGGHPLLTALRQVLRDTVREHVEQIEGRMTARLEASLARIDQRLSAATDLLHEVDARIEVLVGATAAALSKEDLTLVTGRLDRLRDDVKGEMVRTLEARARADREYLATATTALKKSVDAMSTDLRGFDVRPQTEMLARSIEATTTAIGAVSPRLEQIELAVKRGTKVDDTVRGLRAEMGQSFAATVEKTEAVHARVNEIVEELKKPKKGWFT